ncbi:site-specific integrase [Bacteroides congonensis]|uniref:tyrosine-type recombinase/integrase n=1 Tax=Bacteroides congonensis TaxID=1871006 RepID=UPI00265F8BCE|nr:site-specific integrase [Bacteroides congonensis]
MATAKKLPSGSYRVNLYIGMDENGRRQYKSFTADTKKAAEYLAAQFNINRKERQKCELTFDNAAERYIESKRNVLSPSTVRGYYAILRNYCGKLKGIKICNITQEFIQSVINGIAANHSPKTCRNVHGFISAVLSMFAPDMLINTTLPQKQKREIYVPDEREIAEIYQKAKGTVNEIPIFLAAECGLRASEISALQALNVVKSYIIVEEARVLGDDGEEHIKSPKSQSGYRKVPITFEICDYLRANAVDGRVCPRKAVNICNNWDKFRKKHGINENLNFHALRHHFASKCILLGIPQKYIAELMGHSSTDMIEKVYQHIFPSAMEGYARLLRDQMLELYNTKCNT